MPRVFYVNFNFSIQSIYIHHRIIICVVMCNSEVIHIVILPETWGKWGRSPASSPHSQAWPRTASAACRSHGSVCSEPKSASCTGGSSQTLGRCLALAVKCQTGQLKKETKNSINHKNRKNQCRHKVPLKEKSCARYLYMFKKCFLYSHPQSPTRQTINHYYFLQGRKGVVPA